MNKTKIFISQPMNGLSADKIKAERERVCLWLNQKYPDGYEIVDSYIEPSSVKPETNISLWYLAKSIEMLASADVAVFVKGWHNARGCKLEFDCCVQYDIPVVFDLV